MSSELNSRFVLLTNTLENIFDGAQQLKNTSRVVKEFIKLFKIWYQGDQFSEFMRLLIQLIKGVLTFDYTSPFTKRSIDFINLIFKEIVIFEEEKENQRMENHAANENNLNDSVSNCSTNDNDELADELFDPDETVIDVNYLSRPSSVDIIITNYLVKYTFCINTNVRYNSTSLIRKILDSFEEMDENTFNILKKAMTARTFDKVKMIRLIAILALNKLQDSSDVNDEVQEALIMHLRFDSDPQARLFALRTLEIAAHTIENLTNSTRDSNIIVRKTAYTKIADHCEISNFNSTDRFKLLKNGIMDTEDSVKDVVIKKLIPSWIKRLNNDIVRFLEYLNVRNNDEICKMILFTYFSSLIKTTEKDDLTQFHKLVFSFKESHLDNYNLLTKSTLTEENCFFWYMLSCFCKEHNVTYKKQITNSLESEVETDDDSAYNTVDLIDDIIPDLPVYCDYIQSIVAKIIEVPNIEDLEEKNFIFIQLLKMGNLYKIRDSAQWNRVSKTFKEIIQNDELFDTFKDYIEIIIEIFSNYFGNDHELFLDLIFDLINAINNPESVTSSSQLNIDYQQELEKLDALINEKYESRSIANFKNDVDEIDKLKVEIDQLLADRLKIVDAQLSNEKPPRMETNQKVLERLLHISYGFFNSGAEKCDIPRMSTIIKKIILSSLQVDGECEQIQVLALRTLGLYCLPSIELVNYFLKVFIEIFDKEKYYKMPRVHALNFLFDFIYRYGIRDIYFIDHDYKETDLNKSKNYYLDSTENEPSMLERCNEMLFSDVFSQMMYSILDNPPSPNNNFKQSSVQVQLFDSCVKGLCKIMYRGRIYSEDFLARLIRILFVGDIDVSLKHFIKGFMRVYQKVYETKLGKYFEKANPFLCSYSPFLTELSVNCENEKIKADTLDEISTFFNESVPCDLHSQLVSTAIKMLDDCSDKILNLNLNVIYKANFCDLKICDLKNFRKDLSSFSKKWENNSAKSNKKSDKNSLTINLIKKILDKINKILLTKKTSDENTENESLLDDNLVNGNDLDKTIIDPEYL